MKTFVEFMKREGSWLRSRIGSLRERMPAKITIPENIRLTIPEVRVDFREIAESVLLVLLSLLLYGSVVLAQFAFVPVMIITIKRGWKEALVYVASGLVLLLVLMVPNASRLPFDGGLLLISPTHYTFEFVSRLLGTPGVRHLDYFFLFGVLGMFLGSLIARNYRIGFVVFSGLSVYAGIVVLALSFSWFVGGFDRFIAEYSQYVDKKIAAYLNHYMSRLGARGELLLPGGIDYDLVRRKAEVAVELYKKNVIFGVAPKGGYLVKELVAIFIGVVFTKLYMKGKLKRASFIFSLRSYRISDDWVWGLIMSWGLVYINLHVASPLLSVMSWNAAVMISLLFFLRGLAILNSVGERLGIPAFFRNLAFVFLLFYSFILFATIVTGIGVADIWLKIREGIDNMKKRDDK